MNITFDNTYARELEGCSVPWQPAPASRPCELFFNAPLAQELGFPWQAWPVERREAVFVGNEVLPGSQPIAQAYAGHQFGGFSPQLGDGRALLLGEVLDAQGRRRDLALKGSGRTPFSRGGDGKAAVGPMLREVLIGEAMHALGIPTTRALAVVATGDAVQREGSLPGAVLTRVASSHLRVGTFEYFAARGDHVRLQRLLDYALARHDPPAAQADDPALALLQAVVDRQAGLIAQWMGVGFIHGVMNTDNMTISGETIDYGPCAFLEAHDPATVFSSIDRQGRYAYGNQPAIAQWNLARMAESLLPLMKGSEDENLEAARAAMVQFAQRYAEAAAHVWRSKLGLGPGAEVQTLVDDWHALLKKQSVDHTLAWRRLADACDGGPAGESRLWGLFGDPGPAQDWVARWKHQALPDHADPAVAESAAQELAVRLRSANPLVIPRNHRVEEALAAASDEGDLQPFQDLLQAVRRPFAEDAAARYAEPAPREVTACYRTFCGT